MRTEPDDLARMHILHELYVRRVAVLHQGDLDRSSSSCRCKCHHSNDSKRCEPSLALCFGGESKEPTGIAFHDGPPPCVSADAETPLLPSWHGWCLKNVMAITNCRFSHRPGRTKVGPCPTNITGADRINCRAVPPGRGRTCPADQC